MFDRLICIMLLLCFSMVKSKRFYSISVGCVQFFIVIYVHANTNMFVLFNAMKIINKRISNSRQEIHSAENIVVPEVWNLLKSYNKNSITPNGFFFFFFIGSENNFTFFFIVFVRTINLCKFMNISCSF